MQDRTTKFLLAMIAVALWGFLLRPLLMSPSAQAAPSTLPPAFPAIAMQQNGGPVYVVEDRILYVCQNNSGTVVVVSKTPLH